jgi:uncharacterized protein (TIGR04255 family)
LKYQKLEHDVKRVPKRLRKEPLIEAIWQIQFEPAPGKPVGDLLPGILYSALKGKYPNLQFHRLPPADIPEGVAQFDPNLKFAAKYRMEEPNSPFIFQVGDRVITLNCQKPYSGWDAFKEKILELIDAVENSGLIFQLQHHSLRYIDFLLPEYAPDLNALKVTLTFGEHAVQTYPLQMRLELPNGDCTHIVQIASPTEVRLQNGLHTGTIVDLESFMPSTSIDWDVIRIQIDQLHDCSKDLFFQQILTQETINRLDPEY